MRKLLAIATAVFMGIPAAQAQEMDAHSMLSSSTVGVGYRIHFGDRTEKPVHSLRMGFNMDAFGGSSVSESYRIDFRRGEVPMHYIAGMDMATFRSVIMQQGEAGVAAMTALILPWLTKAVDRAPVALSAVLRARAPVVVPWPV